MCIQLSEIFYNITDVHDSISLCISVLFDTAWECDISMYTHIHTAICVGWGLTRLCTLQALNCISVFVVYYNQIKNGLIIIKRWLTVKLIELRYISLDYQNVVLQHVSSTADDIIFFTYYDKTYGSSGYTRLRTFFFLPPSKELLENGARYMCEP